jgi:polyhydroxyalkanoate synthase subunit PhaC
MARSMSVSANEKPMTANKLTSRRSLKSDLARADAHTVKPEEYDELPALTEEILGRAKVNKGGRPVALADIGVPMFVLSTERDHVSPWRFVYKIHLLTETEVNFRLTSGA